MEEQMLSIAEDSGLADSKDIKAFSRVHSKLENMSGMGVDSGIGINGADFWVELDGIEYFINMTRSKKQRMSEKH